MLDAIVELSLELDMTRKRLAVQEKLVSDAYKALNEKENKLLDAHLELVRLKRDTENKKKRKERKD